MPLGKYYCDYCDKQFQDTPSARKRHLQGSQHQRARALWYDSLNADGSAAGLPPNSKGVCHRFVRTGFCQYGDGCKYLHPKQNGMNPSQGMPGRGSFEMVQPPIFCGNQPPGESFPGADVVKDRIGILWGNLPPSLRPPPEGGYPSLPIVDWG